MDLEITSALTLGTDSEDEGLILTIVGKIMDVDENNNQKTIGKVIAYRLDAERAERSRIDIWEAADAYMGELEELAAHIYEGNYVKEKFCSSPNRCANVLYISLLELRPRFRGRGFGLASIVRLIEMMAGRSELIVLKPFPLQYQGKAERDSRAFDSDLKKLTKYYRRLGFRQLAGTPYLALKGLKNSSKFLLSEENC
jgi:GNAT superfamily N-acetyltransferase